MTVLLSAVYCNLALGQAPPTILQIDFENNVQYNQDISDLSKLATDPGVTTAAVAKNFMSNVVIADIVAVNGRPAKGIFFRERRMISLTPTPSLGQAIADVARNFSGFQTAFEILQADGNPIGTILLSGFGGGSPPPPGAPLIQTLSNLAIVGGTGAFLGALGQGGEDPANRRKNGGGKQRWVLHVIPMFQPQIVTVDAGPAVTHAGDFSLVTASEPAEAGEVLSLLATGLGPTRPGVDPGQPFPSSPPATVNSPVEVTVNGKSAEVLGAIGSPAAVDGYQVNFRVPPDTEKGVASIQVSAAWIAGTPVSIAIK
jgi:hypothetical protein